MNRTAACAAVAGLGAAMALGGCSRVAAADAGADVRVDAVDEGGEGAVCPNAPVVHDSPCEADRAGLRCPSTYGPTCAGNLDRIYCRCEPPSWVCENTRCDAGAD